MDNQAKLQAELEAISLWDRMFVDNPNPDTIDTDACMARMFRRLQIVVEMDRLASRPSEPSSTDGYPKSK